MKKLNNIINYYKAGNKPLTMDEFFNHFGFINPRLANKLHKLFAVCKDGFIRPRAIINL